MIFTLGHGILQPAEFARAARGLQVIVDTRSHPYSKHSPHFNRHEMERWVPEFGYRYEWWPQIGGWRKEHLQDEALVARMMALGVDVAAYAGAFPKQRIAARRQPTGDGPEWINQGLYDYAWFTSTPGFLAGVDDLVERFGSASSQRAAVICCESLWWKCHRSLIADHLTDRGVWVGHLPCQQPKRPGPTRHTPHRQALGNRLERYPPEVLEAWWLWKD